MKIPKPVYRDVAVAAGELLRHAIEAGQRR